MKRFLTLLLIAGGLSFAGTANAQTAPKGSADSTQSNKKVEEEKQKSSDIAIDESGTSKPRKKRNSANAPKKSAAPKQSAQRNQQNASSPSPAPAPDGIAIDESGSSKPKPRPKANSTTAPSTKSDSTILAPAGQVGRPE